MDPARGSCTVVFLLCSSCRELQLFHQQHFRRIEEGFDPDSSVALGAFHLFRGGSSGLPVWPLHLFTHRTARRGFTA